MILVLDLQIPRSKNFSAQKLLLQPKGCPRPDPPSHLLFLSLSPYGFYTFFLLCLVSFFQTHPAKVEWISVMGLMKDGLESRISTSSSEEKYKVGHESFSQIFEVEGEKFGKSERSKATIRWNIIIVTLPHQVFLQKSDCEINFGHFIFYVSKLLVIAKMGTILKRKTSCIG